MASASEQKVEIVRVPAIRQCYPALYRMFTGLLYICAYDDVQLASADELTATYIIRDEDHTLGNAVRYVLARNPDISFVGYSIPHPSENKLNLRIQAKGRVMCGVFMVNQSLLMVTCEFPPRFHALLTRSVLYLQSLLRTPSARR